MSQGANTREAGPGARLRLPRAGKMAPAFALAATDGAPVDLATTPKPVALVFLRHLM